MNQADRQRSGHTHHYCFSVRSRIFARAQLEGTKTGGIRVPDALTEKGIASWALSGTRPGATYEHGFAPAA